MAESRFVYVTYIRTTQQKLWEALTKPEFQRQYWFGIHQDCDWKAGSPWKMTFPDGRVADAGEVLEIDPPKKLVLKWRNEFRPELRQEGYSRCAMTLEPDGEIVKLTVTHEIDRPASKLIEAVSGVGRTHGFDEPGDRRRWGRKAQLGRGVGRLGQVVADFPPVPVVAATVGEEEGLEGQLEPDAQALQDKALRGGITAVRLQLGAAREFGRAVGKGCGEGQVWRRQGGPLNGLLRLQVAVPVGDTGDRADVVEVLADRGDGQGDVLVGLGLVELGHVETIFAGPVGQPEEDDPQAVFLLDKPRVDQRRALVEHHGQAADPNGLVAVGGANPRLVAAVGLGLVRCFLGTGQSRSSAPGNG